MCHKWLFWAEQSFVTHKSFFSFFIFLFLTISNIFCTCIGLGEHLTCDNLSMLCFIPPTAGQTLHTLASVKWEAGSAQWLEHRTHECRSWVQIPAGAAVKFSSPGSTFCANSYFGIHSTPVLPQQHVKDPGHSAKSAGGSLQLNMHASYRCGYAWSDNDMVHHCMVVQYTQNTPRWQHFTCQHCKYAT